MKYLYIYIYIYIFKSIHTQITRIVYSNYFTVIDRIMEMKKRFGAAVSEKGWGPKPRQKIS